MNPPLYAQAQLGTLLGALEGVTITDEEHRVLVWLAELDQRTVVPLVALLVRARRSTADLRAALVAAGYDEDDEAPLSLTDLEYFAEFGVLPEAGGCDA